MSIDALYILSNSGDILVQKNFRSSTKKPIIQEFHTEYNKNKGKVETEYPILKIKDNLCSYISSLDLLYVAVFTEEIQVLQVYNILYTVLETLKSVFKTDLSQDTVRHNFSSISLMLDSYLDYGYPVINQRFVLESLIKPEGVFDKIEEVIVGRNQHLKENTGVLEKFIDTISDQKDYSLFRTSTSHISEEILFDVIEYVDCIMDKNGNMISQEVNGEIKVESMINGPWLLNLFITAPNPLSDISVHESLYDTIDSLESEKVLSFIPSNGHYSLMFYNVKQTQLRLPFEVIHSVAHDTVKKTVRIDIKIESRLVRGQPFTVEDLHLKLFIPGGLNSKETTPTYGSVNYTDNNTSALWRIGELKKDQAAKLYIIFEKTDDYDADFSNFTACLKFQVPQLSVSGTKVDKASFKDENVKANKRARAMTKSGYYEIRM